MSYQVLARKFRPTAFDDVVGQVHVTRTLRNAIRMGRIHHAFLFTGTRGCGKTSTARILAKVLNCQKGPNELDPCNECETCLEIAAGSSLDILEIDGASNNGVDAIRELRENVRFMPNKGRYKIYIVDEVHMLSNAAFNALLKTLEEPPAHVVFIFATTEPHQLPTTILSRCQRFDFKRIPPKRIAERLQQIADSEGITVTPVGLSALARAAEGSMRDAQSLFDQVISFAGRDEKSGKTTITDAHVTESLGLIDRKLFSDLLEALGDRDAKAALDVAQRVATAGYEVANFAREMLARVRDLMIVKVVKTADQLVDLSPEEMEILRGVASKFTREEIDAVFLMLESALEEMVRGGAPQLALEMAVLRMAAVEPIAPLAELVARVEAAAAGTPAPPRGGGGGGVRTHAEGTVAEAPAVSFKNWKPPDERGERTTTPAGGRPAPRTGGGGSRPSNPLPGGGGSGGSGGPDRSDDRPTVRLENPDAPLRARAPDRDDDRSTVELDAPAPVPDDVPERTVTATIEAPVFHWDSFLGYVRNRKPLLGVMIAEGALHRFDGETVEIAYDTHGIRADQVRDKDSVEQITVMAGEFMKRPVAVRIVAKPAGARTSTASADGGRPALAPRESAPRIGPFELRKQLREDALASDAVQAAMDVLGAELAEVRPVIKAE